MEVSPLGVGDSWAKSPLWLPRFFACHVKGEDLLFVYQFKREDLFFLKLEAPPPPPPQAGFLAIPLNKRNGFHCFSAEPLLQIKG